ncbi:amino acid adenylation domain-containing protein [uncultured Pantoea sp.]|uniref:amino acid adenylation domain-containing protein n=1 Tax=uncultured Pantoea sp. TaxID=218084 RepID=UPI0025E8D62F|nr:amino acid adenylation domain-containing protein [uncultured Pantoea sp.]
MTVKAPISPAVSESFSERSHSSHSVSLFAMLETHARHFPEQIAVKDAQNSLSYRHFFQQIWSNGKKLNALIDTELQYIGLYCEPSVEMICGAWSILAAERAYLPLAPDYPADRLRYMIEDSGIKMVLTQPHLKAQLATMVTEEITIITLDDLQASAAATVPRHPCHHRERLAYMIYTSGSTGKPKGVMVSYANISHQMAWLKSQFGFDHNDRILQKTPASFDAAQWEILAPAFGSQVIMGPKDCYRDPDALINTLISEQVTVLQSVPTLLQALVEHPLFQDCCALKHVFSGGEILTRNLAQAFFQRLPHAALTNLYGPTECTINASSFTLDPELIAAYPDAIAIGKPAANTLYHVLNPAGEPVVPGETGELYISGLQVAKGYYQRPELTDEKFLPNPRKIMAGHDRLYKTGDLVRQDPNGNTHFVARVDNQIKLRGYRVELDEIRLAIENHHWVKTAAVVVQQDPRSGYQTLVACVELDKRQAALMDQGNHDRHHLSKSSKLQVKAQLSNAGCRMLSAAQLSSSIMLPYIASDHQQRTTAFGRKTYRFFDGEPSLTRQDLIDLLQRQPIESCTDENLATLTLDKLGKLLRNFGQFVSDERLLPKYAYASPGALYATQLYLELKGCAGLPPAIYYYHPVHHCLLPIASLQPTTDPIFRLHFVGNRQAIEPVYKNNLREVLEMETGHMLGLFDELLPELGLHVHQAALLRGALPEWYQGSHDDDYLGCYVVDHQPVAASRVQPELYLQMQQPLPDLDAGLYQYQAGELHFLSTSMLQKRDVIAINQRVFDRAQFGISVVCNGGDREEHYILAGREMHRLQANKQRLGLMSSGYSSKSNNDLPAAISMRAILAEQQLPMESLYFCVGGPISQAQFLHQGMNEDRIHMQGPVELLKEDLAAQLPKYMIPNKVIILDNLPQTANGKVDHQALKALPELTDSDDGQERVPLKSATEKKIAEIWCAVMKWEAVFATDDFFTGGGNSLTAVALVNRINKTFNIKLPLQVIFHTPHIAGLATAVENCIQSDVEYSRLIKLNDFAEKPIFCWPGLGGYPLNLKLLAQHIPDQRAFYGIQARGINEGEIPLPTIQQMALEDIRQIKAIQPTGPYTLWGYSFGARVAFETAAQLEAQGDVVESLSLLAPGAPITQMEREQRYEHKAAFDNPVFLAILFSVFAHQVEGPLLDRCLSSCKTKAEFIGFICQRFPLLQREMVERIIHIVETTYAFSYQFTELQNRQLNASVTIVKAQGDHYSFLEHAPAFSRQPPTIIELSVDHYAVLKQHGIHELVHTLFTTQPCKEQAHA